MADSEPDVTRLLQAWRSGDAGALNALAPVLYRELHRLAGVYMRDERPGHTLQPTALVNEAYLRMVSQAQPDWQSRSHFVAVAAQYMRQILVDYARKRKAGKRGGGAVAVDLEEALAIAPSRPDELLALDEALEQLRQFDARKAQVAEMSFFGGLSQAEIADVLHVHANTVANDLRVGKAWLKTRLQSADSKQE